MDVAQNSGLCKSRPQGRVSQRHLRCFKRRKGRSTMKQKASTTVCEGTSGLSAALSVYSWVSHCGAPQARWPAHGCKHLSCMFIAISNQWHSANEAASCAPEFDKFLMQNIAKVSAMEMIGQRSWDEALAGGKEDHREGPQTDKLQEPDQEDEEDEYEDEPQLQAGSPAGLYSEYVQPS
eukprot:scaffold133329_cov21-Tisochrysis_lutea.AAC.1